MSEDTDLKEQIIAQATKIRNDMRKTFTYSHFSYPSGRLVISSTFLSDVILLNQLYGEFIGKAKAKHSELDKLRSMDDYITQCCL
ncbi:MAG: hypothetical protein QXV09_00380 [Candidatus Bathyarchaeia archaeon]